MSFSIDDLIDDCLLLIFYRLSLGDRIKIRLTCNRWATLMPFDDIDSLDVDSLPFAQRQFRPTKSEYFASDSYKIRRSSILRAFDFILPRIGANLKSLSLGSANGDRHYGTFLLVNNYHFDLITHYCPQLKELEIGVNANLNHMDFAKLAIQLSQMKSLKTLSVCDDRLKDRQKVPFATAFCDQTWPYLTDLIIDFTILRVCKIMIAPQLKDLTLANGNNFTLSAWCEAHPNLSSLKLTETNQTVKVYSPIASLKDLTTLNLRHNPLDDVELNLICSNCPKLTDVNLRLIKVTRFDCLQRLNCLTVLRIVVPANFNESDMLAIAKRGNLKSVHFRTGWSYSSRRSVLDVISLVTFNPNLEVLKLDVVIPNEETILTVLEVCKQLKTFVVYLNAVSSDTFAAIGGCENLSKFKMRSDVSADHYRRLLDVRQQNGVRHRLNVVVRGFSWQQTEENKRLKEELKKVNIFVSHCF